jgi:hypothetical protein
MKVCMSCCAQGSTYDARKIDAMTDDIAFILQVMVMVIMMMMVMVIVMAIVMVIVMVVMQAPRVGQRS